MDLERKEMLFKENKKDPLLGLDLAEDLCRRGDPEKILYLSLDVSSKEEFIDIIRDYSYQTDYCSESLKYKRMEKNLKFVRFFSKYLIKKNYTHSWSLHLRPWADPLKQSEYRDYVYSENYEITHDLENLSYLSDGVKYLNIFGIHVPVKNTESCKIVCQNFLNLLEHFTPKDYKMSLITASRLDVNTVDVRKKTYCRTYASTCYALKSIIDGNRPTAESYYFSVSPEIRSMFESFLQGLSSFQDLDLVFEYIINFLCWFIYEPGEKIPYIKTYLKADIWEKGSEYLRNYLEENFKNSILDAFLGKDLVY